MKPDVDVPTREELLKFLLDTLDLDHPFTIIKNFYAAGYDLWQFEYADIPEKAKDLRRTIHYRFGDESLETVREVVWELIIAIEEG